MIPALQATAESRDVRRVEPPAPKRSGVFPAVSHSVHERLVHRLSSQPTHFNSDRIAAACSSRIIADVAIPGITQIPGIAQISEMLL